MGGMMPDEAARSLPPSLPPPPSPLNLSGLLLYEQDVVEAQVLVPPPHVPQVLRQLHARRESTRRKGGRAGMERRVRRGRRAERSGFGPAVICRGGGRQDLVMSAANKFIQRIKLIESCSTCGIHILKT